MLRLLVNMSILIRLGLPVLTLVYCSIYVHDFATLLSEMTHKEIGMLKQCDFSFTFEELVELGIDILKY